MASPNLEQKYTYADYLTWDDSRNWELIDGIPYAMAPAPTTCHQQIIRKLLLKIGNYLEGMSCEIFHAPFDVRLNSDEEDNTVVQPDLSIICDPLKIDEKGCKGAPDWIIKILSPSTTRVDRILKLNQYRHAGVKEYWMVDPINYSLEICLLDNGHYLLSGYTEEDTVSPDLFPNLRIDLGEILGYLP
ncbi:MAG: Uma2 family endonuclease [Turicibacter sp.]|nr:Uma2 family endonuclease [Turicibacter sp.]